MGNVNKYFSDIQERKVSELLDAYQVFQSGGGRFDKGDVMTDEFLIECKTTTKPKSSFSVQKQWLEKADEQSFEMGRSHYAVAFRFEPEGKDYFVIDSDTFKLAKELIEECIANN